MIQSYWFAWANRYFDESRSDPPFLQLLEPLLGRSINQVAQQIHWKPPCATVSGYRFHQDLRFRESKSSYEDVVRNSVTVGIAIDRATSENGEGSIMKGLTHYYYDTEWYL